MKYPNKCIKPPFSPKCKYAGKRKEHKNEADMYWRLAHTITETRK